MTSDWITLSLWKSLITYWIIGMWTCVFFNSQREQQQFRFTSSDSFFSLLLRSDGFMCTCHAEKKRYVCLLAVVAALCAWPAGAALQAFLLWLCWACLHQRKEDAGDASFAYPLNFSSSVFVFIWWYAFWNKKTLAVIIKSPNTYFVKLTSKHRTYFCVGGPTSCFLQRKRKLYVLEKHEIK